MSQELGMLEFYEKRKLKRRLYSWPIIALLALPVGYSVFVAWHAYLRERVAHANMLAAVAELERLKEREVTLGKEIDRLSSNRGVEQELRDKYEIGKPGERMIVLVNKEKEQKESSPPIKEKSFFRKVWEKVRW